jgi:hypothetical protein
MSSGSCLSFKLYDKIIKMTSKSHETIPLTVSAVSLWEYGNMGIFWLNFCIVKIRIHFPPEAKE